MGTAGLVVIHANPRLSHQVRIAEQVVEGLKRHGEVALISSDPYQIGDAHVVMGPHYALRQWIGHPRLLWIDRCWYGNPSEWVSAGWADASEYRNFCLRGHWPSRWQRHVDEGVVGLAQRRTGGAAVLFGDYGGDVREYRRVIDDLKIDAYRPHPHAEHWADCPVPIWQGAIETVLPRVGLAVGWRTTTLAAAVLAGARVVCFDIRNPAYGAMNLTAEALRRWCYDLAYCQWRETEFADGTAWEWLRDGLENSHRAERRAGYDERSEVVPAHH